MQQPPVGRKRLLAARVTLGMMICHTALPKTKVALTIDSDLLERLDELVDRRRFRNRSQAVEAALADKLRLAWHANPPSSIHARKAPGGR